MVEPRQQAHIDAGDLQHEMNSSGDPQKLYVKLQTDCASHNSNAAEAAAYRQAMANELTQRGLLPVVSAEMLGNEFDKFDYFHKNETTDVMMAQAAQSPDFADPMRQAFMGYLKDHYRDLSSDKLDAEGNSTGVTISRTDVSNFIDNQRQRWQDMPRVQSLLNNNGALFDALDVASHGFFSSNTPDGKISKSDLQAFNANPRNKVHFGDDAQTADFLLQNWNSPEVQRLRDGRYITHDSLVKGLGYENEDQMQAALTARSTTEAADQAELKRTSAASSTPGSDAAANGTPAAGATAGATAGDRDRAGSTTRRDPYIYGGREGATGSDAAGAEAARVAAARAEAAQQQVFGQIQHVTKQAYMEGPWAAAHRLANGDENAERDLTRLFKKSFQQHNNDSSDTLDTLSVGYQWVNKDNLNEMMQNASFKKIYDQMITKAVADAGPAPNPSRTPARLPQVIRVNNSGEGYGDTNSGVVTA